METASQWGGTVVIRPGLLAFLGAVGPTERHAHHAIQIVHAAGELVLRDASHAELTCRQAIIPAGEPHTIVHGTPHAVLLFLDPESVLSRQLMVRGGPGCDTVAAWALLAAPLAGVPAPGNASSSTAELADAVDRIILALHGNPTLAGAIGRDEARHPAVERALETLAQRLSATVRLSEVARDVGWSLSRLSHVFTKQVGLPMRSYVLWLRLERAMTAVATGASLTQAAHSAGFADSAHLTRVCRRMFGLAPSQITRGMQWRQDW